MYVPVDTPTLLWRSWGNEVELCLVYGP